MNNKIQKILDSYQNEMVETLQKLIRIKSVVEEGSPSSPFGEGIRESLDFIMELGKAKGFECNSFDHYACELNLGEGEESVGVVSHLDVVPEGSGWSFGPYGGELVDGKIYGRGAVDDKGPLVASFYACLAIKESGETINKKIKHIIGTNEEGGRFPCIEHYKKNGRVPGCGIVPDSWFPVAYAEKGFYNYQFTKKLESSSGIDSDRLPRLVDISGGEALNIVPMKARASFFCDHKDSAKIKSAIDAFPFADRVTIEEEKNILTIIVKGKAAHASTPEIGINAIAILLQLLTKINFLPYDLFNTIHSLADLVANDYDGTGLGVNYSDHTGDLTNNIGIISFQDETLHLKMNIRCPVTFHKEDLESKLSAKANENQMSYELLNYSPPFYMEPEHPMIRLLTGIYQEFTGDKETKPKAHGGGSYARILENFVPFGPSIEGEELCFHKQNEHISCERLFLLSKIYAEALYQLAK